MADNKPKVEKPAVEKPAVKPHIDIR